MTARNTIRAAVTPPGAAFVARLAGKARAMAEAQLAARVDEHRWRKPSLLWPLFGDR